MKAEEVVQTARMTKRPDILQARRSSLVWPRPHPTPQAHQTTAEHSMHHLSTSHAGRIKIPSCHVAATLPKRDYTLLRESVSRAAPSISDSTELNARSPPRSTPEMHVGHPHPGYVTWRSFKLGSSQDLHARGDTFPVS